MRRVVCILLMLILFNISVFAQKDCRNTYPRFTFGAEWGYVAEIWSGFHNNFFAPEGYRVDQRESSFGYKGNTDTYIHIGYNLDEKWNLAMYLGYAGIDKEDKILPVTIRGTRFFGPDPMADRFFTFLDLGSGICLKRPVQEILAAKTGLGYRLSLSRDTKLDIHIAARATYTHMNIIYDGVPIDADRTNRNQFLTAALSLGMAVVF